MNRRWPIILGLSLSTAGLLVACGPATTTPKASGTNAANAAPPPTSVQSQAPSESVPAGAPAAGGSATTFCHSYGEVAKIPQFSPSGTPTEADFTNVSNALEQASNDMRATAPAEIKNAVEFYSVSLTTLYFTLQKIPPSTTDYQNQLKENAGSYVYVKYTTVLANWVAKNCTTESLQ